MKKIKLILLVLLISSGFFVKPVVADTTDVYFNDFTQDYDSLFFCYNDTITLHGTGSGNGLGFVSPSNGTYESVEMITIIGDSVHYYNHEFNKDSVEFTTVNGEWSYINPYAFNRHLRLYFSSPLTPNPWPEESLAICGVSDTLYAGDGNYQQGVEYIWEKDNEVIAQGFYPNDSSLIVDETGVYKLTAIGGCDQIIDQISMTLTTATLPNLGPDITVCDPEVLLTLSLTETYDTYLWSDGSTEATLDITAPDTFYVDVWNGCMIAERDSIIVTQIDNPWLWLGYDQLICDGTSTTLDMGADYDVMSWSKIQGNDTIWGAGGSERYYTTSIDEHMLAFARMTGCPSMMDDIVVTLAHPYDQSALCIATVDTNGLNKVVWDPRYDEGIASYNIWKNSNTLLGNVTIDSIVNMGQAIVYDHNTDPAVQATEYSVTAIDTCGNESELSASHKTVWASASYDVNGNIVLTRTNYVVSDGSFFVENYLVLIDSLSNGKLDSIDIFEIGNMYYTVVDPLLGASYYVGAGLPYYCNGSGNKSGTNLDGISVSNGINSTSDIKTHNQLNISIYPNPSTGIFHIDGIGIGQIEVFDITGQLILSKFINNNSIDLSNFKAGFYTAEITNTQGQSIIKKIIIQ